MGCCKDCDDAKTFEESFEEGVPYHEEVLTPTIVMREFWADVNPNWLKWHMDEEDREVLVLMPTDWKFQMDNQLPIQLKEGMRFNISAGEYHRLIKGTTDLLVEIHKKS